MFRFRRPRADHVPVQPEPGSGRTPDADHAWETLGLVNEWIRHSDAKAAVTLAFTGALAAMTFNLVKDFHQRSTLSDVLVVLTGLLLILTAVLCGRTLTPRLSDKEASGASINLLYFGSIAHHFKGRRTQYAEALKGISADPSELIEHLADQIHANAGIASTKARSARSAIRSALLTSAAVASLAIAVGVGNS